MNKLFGFMKGLRSKIPPFTKTRETHMIQVKKKHLLMLSIKVQQERR